MEVPRGPGEPAVTGAAVSAVAEFANGIAKPPPPQVAVGVSEADAGVANAGGKGSGESNGSENVQSKTCSVDLRGAGASNPQSSQFDWSPPDWSPPSCDGDKIAMFLPATEAVETVEPRDVWEC